MHIEILIDKLSADVTINFNIYMFTYIYILKLFKM